MVLELHVVVVVDPRRYHANFESTLNATDWVEMELESTWVKMALECGGRKGFVFQMLDREAHMNKTWVRIDNSVSVHTT